MSGRFARNRLARVSALLFLTSWHGASAPAAMQPEWVEKWSEDLDFAAEQLEERHPDAFHSLSRQDLRQEILQLTERLPELEHYEVAVELARIVARVGDGHTRLTLPLAPGVDFMQGHSETPEPALSELLFHQYPIRLAIDADGVWIYQAQESLEVLVGGRLLAIDGRPIEEVIEAVQPTVRRDNVMQVLHHLPMHLVLPEVLHARGVVQSVDTATFTIQTLQGKRSSVEISPVPKGHQVAWVGLYEATRSPEPLYQSRSEENFWFRYLEAEQVIYLQFNTVYDKPEETIRQFSERLLEFLAGHPVNALVIDLRHNRGGNQSLAQPLLHAVLRSELDKAGSLFTIIGRTTFSAAMNFSLEMEKHTQTLFVGEPTGSKPNHYGDSRKVQLPNSNLTLRISSLYWQWSPRDDRPWIAPHIEVPPSRQAALQGTDPALETILEIVVPSDHANKVAGSWEGNLPPASYGRDSVLQIERKGSSLQAAVTIPAFDLESGEVQNPRWEPPGITFEIPVGEETIAFKGRVVGRWMVGEGELGSVRYPFLLIATP